jgi:hypothetical protein
MERIGVEPHVIEVCLGHALKGVAGTYRQYGHLPEKAECDETAPVGGGGGRGRHRPP